MKITDVETICLRIPPLEADCEWGDDAFLVRVHTDEGIIGVGESDTSPTCARAFIDAPGSNLHCMGLRRVLIGQDPLDIEKLWDQMYLMSYYSGRRGLGIHAISAVDIALWDIAAQYRGVPLYELLGGKQRDFIRAYATFVPDRNNEINRKTVQSLLEEGYSSLKFGGGALGDDPDRDVAIVKAVREAAGDPIALQIDLAAKWKTRSHTEYMLERLEPFDLRWVEEPIPSDRTADLRKIRRSKQTPLAGGEDLTTHYEFELFLKETGISIIQPDISRCGGVTEARKIYGLARRYSAEVIPHVFSTGVLLLATMHFLASIRDDVLLEYPHSKSPLFGKLVKNLPRPQNGAIHVPAGPGLGVELDEDVIAAYRI